jgi:hypothetical protein
MKILKILGLSILCIVGYSGTAMADPISIIAMGSAVMGSLGTATAAVGGLSTLATVASAGVGLFGAISGGASQQAALAHQTEIRRQDALHNSQVADFNAAVSRQNANQARLSAQLKADDIRRDTTLRLSTLRSQFAKAGVSTGSGSSLLVAMEQARQGSLGESNELYIGNLNAQGFETEEMLRANEAERLRNEAENITKAGQIESQTAGIQSGLDIFAAGKTLFKATNAL